MTILKPNHKGPARKLTREQALEAVRQLHLGRSIRTQARELGVVPSTLRRNIYLVTDGPIPFVLSPREQKNHKWSTKKLGEMVAKRRSGLYVRELAQFYGLTERRIQWLLREAHALGLWDRRCEKAVSRRAADRKTNSTFSFGVKPRWRTAA